MVIDGRTIIEKHLVSFPNDKYTLNEEEQIQPNGIDLRAVAITEITGKIIAPTEGSVTFDNIQKTPVPIKDGYWSLRGNAHYTVDFREQIAVADGFIAWIITRSSLLRGGIMITSALWDTGFQGALGGVIRTYNPIEIQFGARLAQIVFSRAEFNGLRYDGRYQNTTSQTALMTNG